MAGLFARRLPENPQLLRRIDKQPSLRSIEPRTEDTKKRYVSRRVRREHREKYIYFKETKKYFATSVSSSDPERSRRGAGVKQK